MRVIAGKAKGRRLKTVSGDMTRPTTDKIKESIFNIIKPFLNGGNVLDLYAGSGALGIEALSRGMSRAVFVDKDWKCVEIIKNNVEICNLSELTEVYRNDAIRALHSLVKREIQFELIFLDPPYLINNYQELLKFIANNNLLIRQGIIVVEHDVKISLPSEMGVLTLIKNVSYGNTGVTIYQAY